MVKSEGKKKEPRKMPDTKQTQTWKTDSLVLLNKIDTHVKQRNQTTATLRLYRYFVGVNSNFPIHQQLTYTENKLIAMEKTNKKADKVIDFEFGQSTIKWDTKAVSL